MSHGGRDLVALTWVGTRGVITLAAAFALPMTVGGDEPLPGRELLLLCAYVVVLVTLVAVNRVLRRRGFWSAEMPEPDLLGSERIVPESAGDRLARGQAHCLPALQIPVRK